VRTTDVKKKLCYYFNIQNIFVKHFNCVTLNNSADKTTLFTLGQLSVDYSLSIWVMVIGKAIMQGLLSDAILKQPGRQ
jgi:thioredoxin-related protein